MSDLPRRRIDLFVAVNELGQSYVSQVGAQDALTNLAQGHGGKAFRVVDITVDIPFASEEETKRRRREQLKFRVVD